MSILANEDTRIIVQGITGREATAFTHDMIDYGSKVVAGVTPGKGGFNVYNIPVYDTVKRAIAENPADASVISVPAPFVKGAGLEALDNGIKLIIIITERVPRRDIVELIQYAREQSATIIGPNSLGLISPDRIKIGMAGGPVKDVKKAYSRGPIGVISRSGGMTTEIANLLTTHGIGQSTCISIGGDPIVGSNFIDLVPLFHTDPETMAVVLFCEPGGVMEERLADYLKATELDIPIMAFVAGRFADDMPGVRFGHAAAIVEGETGSTKGKIEKFEEVGIKVAGDFSDIINYLKEIVR